MSREAVAIILGRACLDAKFLDTLKRHGPTAVAKDMKLKLSPEEVNALKNSNLLKDLQACNKDVQADPQGIGEDFGS